MQLIAFIMFAVLSMAALAFGQDAAPSPEELPRWVDLLTTVVLALIGIFGSTISALFIKGRLRAASYIQEKVKNEAVAGILENVNQIAWQVAEGMYRDTVADLKRAKKPGEKLSKTDIHDLKAEAVLRMRKRLGAATVDLLSKSGIGDVDGMLADAVSIAAQLSKERNGKILQKLETNKYLKMGDAKPQKDKEAQDG
jgi:hypothetical protein